MSQSGRLNALATSAIVVSALAIAGSVVYRTVLSSPPSMVRVAAAPVPVPDSLWGAAAHWALPLAGPAEAPVTLIEFTDLECPACRGFQPILDEIVEERPDRVRLLYMPHPLTYHRFANGAANAAECAAAAGALGAWIEVVYRMQDSLGLISWQRLAHEASIEDTSAIAACATQSVPFDRVTAGLELGAKLGLTGTPMLLVNGLRYQQTPSKSELEALIDSILQADQAVTVEPFVLEGQVWDSATMTSLGDAHVALVDSDGIAAVRSRTDSTGAFSLEATGGRYRLIVEREGYRGYHSRLADFEGDTRPMLVIIGRTVDSGP